jgi:DNA ligase (NAD+)
MNINIKDLTDDPYKYGNTLTIHNLEKLLRKLSYSYYNTKKPLVNDDVFDILKELLEKRDPKNPFLREIGAPISKNKVKLPYGMGSLNKIKPDTGELEKWMTKYSGKKVLSDKLDGNSALLVKTKEGLKLYSRGDGFEGQDISHLITYVIPNKSLDLIPEGMAIRGELIISKANFEKVQKTLTGRGGLMYSNARNTVSGLVNSKTYSIELAELVDFVAYMIINPTYYWHEQMDILKKLKLNVVYNEIVNTLTTKKLSELLLKRRKESNYEIDGIVVYDSEKKYMHQSGNPEYGFAYKQLLTDQMAEARVIKVEWNPSKDGYLKPRVFIEPVKLVGVEIDKATGHNAAFIRDNIIGPGAIVKIVRSGDVIPKIEAVIKPASNGKPQLPETSQYIWNKTNIDIISVDNKELKNEITSRSMEYFFDKLNVKYISIGIIRKLVNEGIIDIFQWIKYDRKKMAEIDGIGEKLITKIDESFKDAISKITLYQLMCASNIFGRNLATKKLKLIVQEIPDVMKISKDKLKELIKDIDGFDDILTAQFVDNIDKFIVFYDRLDKLIDLSHLHTKKIKTNGKFKNKVFVFTGYRNKDWISLIENEGGKVTESVSKNTTTLIYTDTSSNKYKKALELNKAGNNIEIMTPEEALKKYFS